MSELVNGLIPPHTVCPYRAKCSPPDADHCPHRGLEHTVAFSCAMARGWALATPPLDVPGLPELPVEAERSQALHLGLGVDRVQAAPSMSAARRIALHLGIPLESVPKIRKGR